MTDITVAELMSRMPKPFVRRLKGVNTVIQYHLNGAEGGDWIIRIQDGQCTVVEGVAENPNVTLAMSPGL
jgi:hypothetical protein